MEQRLYFAYGSNINLDQMKYRCPGAVPAMPVVLNNYELSFRGMGGVATILPKNGAKVHGLLWDLTPACEQSLDRYEGFPNLYGKETVTVKDKNGLSYSVMVYVMTPNHAKLPMEPSRGYFYGIMDGYKQNGIPVQPLYNALRATRNEISEMEAQSKKDFRQLSFDWWRPGRSNSKKPSNKGR